MNITFWLNGVKRQAEVRPDELLLDLCLYWNMSEQRDVTA